MILSTIQGTGFQDGGCIGSVKRSHSHSRCIHPSPIVSMLSREEFLRQNPSLAATLLAAALLEAAALASAGTSPTLPRLPLSLPQLLFQLLALQHCLFSLPPLHVP
mmetsp:Transcript_54260/g.115796  ORF Transcript_54260/g.115796 Transcript_54260/m.115796 type:complete len:106 (-) Transcript_54260:621-938(-)